MPSDVLKVIKDPVFKIFNPTSIAVIGASDKPHSVGNAIFRNLLFGNYKGILYPVNPTSASVSGVKSYPEVSSIEEDIDLAIIIVPRNHVVDILRDCGEKGITSVIVITAGFKEIGGEGILYEEKLIEIAEKYGMAVVGPNCFGAINTDPEINLNATFARTIPHAGNVSFISQSGSAGAYALEYAASENIGIAKFVSIGNKAVLNENHFLEALSRDENTDVILAYIEHFENLPEFIRLAKKITTGPNPKPILVIKSGGSKSGHRAAASHTGAIVEQDDMLDHIFRQSGILRVSTMEELFDLTRCFTSQPPPKGKRMAIITNAGGPAIISCDEAEKYGLEIPEIDKDTQKFMLDKLPPTVSAKNPVDLVGDAGPDRYRVALEAVINSEDIDMIQVLAVPQVMVDLKDIAKAVTEFAPLAREKGKPIVTSFAGFGRVESIDTLLHKYNIPNYTFPESAVKAMGYLALFGEWIGRTPETPQRFESDGDLVEKIIRKARKQKRSYLTQPESYAIFEAYGFPTAGYKVAGTEEEAVSAAEETGYPVVMKVISPDIIHKFDVGGILVNIGNEEELRLAYRDIHSNVKKNLPRARVEGVLVQEMVPAGVELIMGAIWNREYGHLIMCGLGGTYVEIFKDVSFRLAPLTAGDAKEMLNEIKAGKILRGFRGIPASDRKALVELLQRLSQLVTDFPSIMEIDLNPVFALPDGAKIADVRILLES